MPTTSPPRRSIDVIAAAPAEPRRKNGHFARPQTRTGIATALVVLGIAGSMVSVLVPAQAATQQTVVTLGFDDGRASQWNAGPILKAHGASATFYLNSNRIGTSGYLTQAQLRQLSSDGQEMGGHTADHLYLADLTPSQQQHQVCDDATALRALNLGPVVSFAYPFGGSSYPDSTKQLIRACGYSTARTVGGIASPDGCATCPYAETLPPADPLFTATPSSVKPSTTLGTLKGFVTSAESHGGGWVQLVFHDVCDGCSSLGVSPGLLSAFLDWLMPRSANGTVVRTAGQATTVGPPPTGPEVRNPSLEADGNADGVPDCWQRGTFGSNSANWVRTTDARTGSFAQRIDVTAFTSGDRKLVVQQDSGTCAPPVLEGRAYTVKVWYKATVPVSIVTFQRNSSGWNYWQTGPALPATATWQQAAYTTATAPAGATHLSFGLSIGSVGSVTTDDYSVALR